MKMLILALAVAVGFVAASYHASAQEPVQSTPAAASATPTDPPGGTATVQPTPPPELLPPTPGPPSPTPRLPEEGGPTGGILAGHLYVDNDGSKSFTPGDTPLSGGVGIDEVVDAALRAGYSGVVDSSGKWEVRALPDGVYRVWWDASALPEDQWPLTVPPVESITINPIRTVHVITRTVEIKGANRIIDIDFGVPPQPPVVGEDVVPQLPSTGSGGGGTASLVLLYTAIGVSMTLGLGAIALRWGANWRE